MLSHDTRIHGLTARTNAVVSVLRVTGHVLVAAARIAGNIIDAVFFEWPHRMRQRRELAAMDDRSLRDIGLTRADVDKELRKRPWNM
jgi:uncharacterized protein YjiS (DUF1127 family)